MWARRLWAACLLAATQQGCGPRADMSVCKRMPTEAETSVEAVRASWGAPTLLDANAPAGAPLDPEGEVIAACLRRAAYRRAASHAPAASIAEAAVRACSDQLAVSRALQVATTLDRGPPGLDHLSATEQYGLWKRQARHEAVDALAGRCWAQPGA